MPDRLDWSNITRHGQHTEWHAQELVTVPGGRAYQVRYLIDHDTSYWSQSSATAEVWSQGDLAWHELASFLPGMWAKDPRHPGGLVTNAAGEPNATLNMRDAMTVLQKRAAAILAAG